GGPLPPARRPQLERHAGRPHDHDHRLLLEAGLVGLDDFVEARNVIDLAGKHDLHDLARLANDLVPSLLPPLACRIEHGEPVREAGHDLTAAEAAEVASPTPAPPSDVAANPPPRRLGRSWTAETIHQLRIGAAGKRQNQRQGRRDPNGHWALTAVD